MSQKLVISGNYLIVDDSIADRIWRHVRGGTRWYMSPDGTEYTIHHEDDGKDWTYKTADAVDIFDQPIGIAGMIQFMDENTGFSAASGGSEVDFKNGTVGDIKASALTEAQMTALDDTWVLADGRNVGGSEYESITGNNSVPDLRGQFLRGLDQSGTIDPEGAGRTLLDTQADEFKSHSHTYSGHVSLGASGNNNTGQKEQIDTQTDLAGGAETRPKNISVNYFIKIN